MDSGLPCVIRIPLSLHAHVALSRYVDVCITALVRASPHRAVCNIHAPLVDTRQFCSAFINAGISCFFLETTFGRYAMSFSSMELIWPTPNTVSPKMNFLKS